MKLRRNWVVEELVAHFAESRDELLGFGRKVADTAQQEDGIVTRPKKRRKLNEQSEQPVERRNTRSQSRKTVQSSQDSSSIISVADSDDGSEYEEARTPNRKPTPPSAPTDGLVACPACDRRMKEEAVYTHLDTCTGASADAGSPNPQSRATSIPAVGSIAYSLPQHTAAKDRLPTINYAVLSENQLRRKLRELGIPNTGSKLLLQRRHTEWLNLWNANCDSRHSRPKRDLLRDLDTWERTLGRQIANNAAGGRSNGVMVKEFDRNGYVKSHKGDFDELIRLARVKAQAKKDQVAEATDNGQDEAKTAAQRDAGGRTGGTPVPVPTFEECFRPRDSTSRDARGAGVPSPEMNGRVQSAGIVVPESPGVERDRDGFEMRRREHPSAAGNDVQN